MGVAVRAERGGAGDGVECARAKAMERSSCSLARRARGPAPRCALHQAKLSSALFTIGLTLVYIAVMLGLVRRFVDRQELTGRLSQNATAVVLIGLVLSALVTEYIGIHALFGAFLVGAVIPHESRLAKEMTHKLEDVTVIFFLPAFFAFTGMRTQIGLVHGGELLNLGLDLEVISPPLFAMMVIMALVTTLMTTPALHLLTRGRPLDATDLSTSASG
jgi:Kef-type K+ transport system membrane component KefB